MKAIGCLRVQVWDGEGSLDHSLFPDSCWLGSDDLLCTARHWCIRANSNNDASNTTDIIIAAARLTLHDENDTSRDLALWREKGIALRYPVCDLGRLVVRKDYRRRGLARRLVKVRIEAAKSWGATAILCTASADNVPLLASEGFVHLGHTIVFADRPNTVFHAMHLLFDDKLK
ncbi:unnamed protein product [Polarella glacialis]|uniref:N-acetyltransferase domain-containing protein n=1 Tax=Polarella glacialis TaxID=89957 RepID=A0A813LXP4_POLGL|nr:unnamed protein product [Polarella glacialis]CAE8740992.1 unnamed protein product [Polarella glacialis]